MAQTLKRRIEKKEWKEYLQSISLLIIDEAHDSSCNFLFEHITPDCFVVGVSATPVRYGNQRQLGLDYNSIVTGPSIQFLIDQGYLCRCRLFSLDAPKMDDVDFDYGRGDYSLAQMAKKFQSKPLYVGAVNNWERLAKSTKTIVFCCSSTQAIEITKEFCSRGYKAKYCLSGSFDDDQDYSGERKEIIDSFARDEFDILVNVGIAVAGLDVPSIKTCVLCYSTISLTKYLQSIGRASRPHPSKNGEFICLDMGANFEKLGRYEQDRQWYLWHNTGKGGGPSPTKQCPQCNRLIPIQAQDCPFCQYHFPTKREVYEIELAEIVAKPTEHETLEQYVARKKLEGWSNNRILAAVCNKNADNPKSAFLRAIEVLRTNHGAKISPQYWFFFKKNILKQK
jgi:superfamily II DNA or RNA helicase